MHACFISFTKKVHSRPNFSSRLAGSPISRATNEKFRPRKPLIPANARKRMNVQIKLRLWLIIKKIRKSRLAAIPSYWLYQSFSPGWKLYSSRRRNKNGSWRVRVADTLLSSNRVSYKLRKTVKRNTRERESLPLSLSLSFLAGELDPMARRINHRADVNTRQAKQAERSVQFHFAFGSRLRTFYDSSIRPNGNGEFISCLFETYPVIWNVLCALAFEGRLNYVRRVKYWKSEFRKDWTFWEI